MQQELATHTRGMRVLERRIGRPLQEVFEEMYLDRGMTQQQIADELGIDVGSVSRWMARLGIEARYLGPRKVAS